MGKRFEVPAVSGCGKDDLGPCFSCAVRALRRRGRWIVRQLLPLRYATHYHSGGDIVSADPGDEGRVVERQPTYVNVAYWRMWFGRVFASEHHRWQVAD